MHIVMATVGTRGDAQPYVALGAELIRRGHRVTMATHDDHRALAESRGLGFRSVCGSFRAVVETPAGRAWLESSDSPTRYVSAFRACFDPLVDAWLADFDAALADCDAVLAHSFAMGALVAGSRRKLPMALLSPFAVVPTGEHSLLGLPRIPLLGPWLERTLFRKFFDDVWTVAHAGIARYLAQHGERPPAGSYRASLLARGVRHLHLASPAIFPRPTDWPECAEVTGFCFLDALPTWKPPARLAEFLAEGPPPIYIGFGSMTGMAPAALSALTRKAVEEQGQSYPVAIRSRAPNDSASSRTSPTTGSCRAWRRRCITPGRAPRRRSCGQASRASACRSSVTSPGGPPGSPASGLDRRRSRSAGSPRSASPRPSSRSPPSTRTVPAPERSARRSGPSEASRSPPTGRSLRWARRYYRAFAAFAA